jgi:hypothetical protein
MDGRTRKSHYKNWSMYVQNAKRMGCTNTYFSSRELNLTICLLREHDSLPFMVTRLRIYYLTTQIPPIRVNPSYAPSEHRTLNSLSYSTIFLEEHINRSERFFRQSRDSGFQCRLDDFMYYFLPGSRYTLMTDTAIFFRFLIKEPVKNVSNYPEWEKSDTQYTWHKPGFFASWTPQGKAVTLCFNTPAILKDAIIRSTMTTELKTEMHTPFKLHNILVEETITLFDKSVWAWRNILRDLEKVSLGTVAMSFTKRV